MPNIIIVDDDEDDIYFFKKACARIKPSPEVVALKDGAELLALIDSTTALDSVVLLDLNMPNVGGIEVLKRLNESEKINNLVVITYSTSSNPSDIKLCYDLGVKSYITKPDSNVKLTELVSTLCKYWFDFNHTSAKI